MLPHPGSAGSAVLGLCRLALNSACVSMGPSGLCLRPFSYKTLCFGFFRAHLNPGSAHPKILSLVISAKALSPNKVTHIDSGGHILGGGRFCTIQPTIPTS